MSEPLPIDLGIPGLGPAVRIGSGGFADVYRAEQLALRRNVAVKVLRAPADDDQARMRFERECHAVGAVSGHPNIVGVHRVGQTGDGRPYLVMEYCPDGSLFDRLRQSGPRPAAEVVDVAIKIGRALGVAHAAGVLHRDVKPANILVTAYGEPALADFGIARIEGGQQTATGMVTASIAHAAPEVIRGETPSHQSDLYSLGSTMFELVTGRAPHVIGGDDTPWALMQRVMNDPVPDPSEFGLPDPLAATIRLATRSNPLARFESADAFVASLNRGSVDLAHASEETLVPPDAAPPIVVVGPEGPEGPGEHGGIGAAASAPASPMGAAPAPPLTPAPPLAPAAPVNPEPRPSTDGGSRPAPALASQPASSNAPVDEPPPDLTIPMQGGAGATAVVGPPPVGHDGVGYGNEPVAQPPGLAATTHDHPYPSSGPRRSMVPILIAAAMVAALIVLALVLLLPGGSGDEDPTGGTNTTDTTGDPGTDTTADSQPDPEIGDVTVSFDDATTGPLSTAATYSIDVSGGAADGMFQVVVDGEIVETTESPITFSPPAGRHELVIRADEADAESAPIQFYAVGDLPAAGYRANLLSITEAPGNWSIALARFDELIDAGHTDVALLSSSDFPQLTPGFWNFFVAGFGEDRGAAEDYCASFGLAIPQDCFVARFDPDA